MSPSISALTADFSENLPLLDSNVQKTGDLITLKYDQTEWIKQSFASDYENVNPFNVISYQGEMRLTPISDTWVANIYVQNSKELVENINIVKTRGRWWGGWYGWYRYPWPGYSRWGNDEHYWLYGNFWTYPFLYKRHRTGWWWGWPLVTAVTSKKTTQTEIDYVESVVTNSDPDPYMRSRNVQFVCDGLKPFTRHYGFLGGNGDVDVIPKLIEISMISGTFKVGENISIIQGTKTLASFRLARPDHKFGDFTNPEVTYQINPYSRTTALPSVYSPSSTVLNIDTFGLSEESLPKWCGYIEKNAQIVGESSKAVAQITDIRLITDDIGDLIGCFFIRDPNSNPSPPVRITTGDTTFKINADPTNSATVDKTLDQISEASATYSGNGITNTTTTNTVSIRPTVTKVARKVAKRDPLAQSFTVDETGAFLTSVDVYFYSKDSIQPLYVELRTVNLGLPTDELVQDYARVTINPSQIKTSFDASVPTRITFPSPIYLAADTEYALVFICPTSDKYNMWVSTMGKKTIETQSLPDAQSVYITRQYLGGSLYKSQNGTIWTPSQSQDLKFTLYKAKFVSNVGDVVFYNPSITNGQAAGGSVPSTSVPILPPNPIETLPRKIIVGITTSISTQIINQLVVGTKISWRNAYGYIERLGGPIKGALTIINSGIGYSTSSGLTTFYNVPLYTITGKGSGAVGIVTVNSSGKVDSISITGISSGSGYAAGDILGITTSIMGKGKGAVVSVGDIHGIDTLFLTNVQGEKFISIYDGATSDLLYYYDSLGQQISLGSTQVTVTSQVYSPLYTGDICRVYQFNHGYHGYNHKVELLNIVPNTIPILLTAPIGITDTVVSIANTSEFVTFQNANTSSGYVVINNEIMKYSGIGNGTLIISERGSYGSPIRIHPFGSYAKKYEIKGFSLTKVNTTHEVITRSIVVNNDDEIDRYYLRIPRDSGRETGDTQQNFTEGGLCGGIDNPIASQNHQFNSINPQFNIITPGTNTKVNSQIRTISGTSAGGTESSYIDQGYQDVQLNKVNFFSSPRLVASYLNEDEYLSNLPNKKSLSLRIKMESQDENLSPVVDLQTSLFVLGRNKINNPITDYSSDGRVNLIQGDPHSAVYMTKKISLEKSATSLKVYISAYRPAESDFRVLYQLFKADSSEVDQSFTLFPGYDNLINTGIGYQIIDPSANNGRPDKYVRPSADNEFLEYEFTADDLEPFIGFSIKIVMSSTNEAHSVRLKDLRCIALA